MSEHKWACMSFNVLATLANFLASKYVGWWGEYCAGVAYAMNLASYLYQVLCYLAGLIEDRHRVRGGYNTFTRWEEEDEGAHHRQISGVRAPQGRGFRD